MFFDVSFYLYTKVIKNKFYDDVVFCVVLPYLPKKERKVLKWAVN